MENVILADEPFAKGLRIFETFVLVDNTLSWKLVSSLEFPIKFNQRFKVSSVSFLIAGFHLLRFKLENFTFNVLYCVILI